MALEILTPPKTLAFLSNSIPVVLRETAANFRRFLYKITLGGVDTEQYEAYRDASNKAVIDLSALLTKFFDISEYELPDLTDTAVQLLNNQTSLIKAYTLTAKSQFTIGADSTLTEEAYVCRGGLSYLKNKTDTTFLESIENGYPILSPILSKKTTPNGKEFFSIANIANDFVSPTSLRIVVFIANQAGAEVWGYDEPITQLDRYKTMLLDMSYSKAVAPITSDKVSYYRFYVIDEMAGYRSPEVFISVDNTYKPQTTEILYINAKGGLSTIRLFGEREDMHDVAREQISKYLAPTAELPQSGNHSRINFEAEGFKIATGYYENWKEFREVLELFRASAIWEIRDEELLPVELTTKKIQTRTTNLTEPPSEILEFKYLMSQYD